MRSALNCSLLQLIDIFAGAIARVLRWVRRFISSMLRSTVTLCHVSSQPMLTMAEHVFLPKSSAHCLSRHAVSSCRLITASFAGFHVIVVTLSYRVPKHVDDNLCHHHRTLLSPSSVYFGIIASVSISFLWPVERFIGKSSSMVFAEYLVRPLRTLHEDNSLDVHISSIDKRQPRLRETGMLVG